MQSIRFRMVFDEKRYKNCEWLKLLVFDARILCTSENYSSIFSFYLFFSLNGTLLWININVAIPTAFCVEETFFWIFVNKTRGFETFAPIFPLHSQKTLIIILSILSISNTQRKSKRSGCIRTSSEKVGYLFF